MSDKQFKEILDLLKGLKDKRESIEFKGLEKGSIDDFVAGLIQYNKQLDDIITKQKKQVTQQQVLRDINNDVAEAQREYKDFTVDTVKEHDALLIAQNRITEESQKQRDGVRDAHAALEDHLATFEDIRKENGSLTEDQQFRVRVLLDQRKVVGDLLTDAERQHELQEQIRKQAENQAVATNSVADATDNLIGRLTGITAGAYENSLIGKIEKTGDWGSALSTVGKQITQTLAPQNMFAATVSKVFEATQLMVLATDDARASINKATSTTGQFDDVLSEVHMETVSLGVNISEASEAFSTLYREVAMFSKLSDEAKGKMTKFTATLNELGVDVATTAQLIQDMSSGLGMTGDEMEGQILQVAGFAKAIDVPIDTMIKGLNAAMPVLAVYGDKAVEVFKGVAAASKLTGIETGRLLDIVGQFDTFESAAESVGRLNGILGGNYLNSLQMVNMTEEERIRALLGAMEASGKSFSELERFEQKAIAASIGITDLAEANNFLNKSVSAYDELTAKSDAAALSQEQLAEMSESNRTMMEKLENIMQAMGIAVSPIVDLFHGILNIFLALQRFTGGFFVPALFGVIGAYALLTKVLGVHYATKRSGILTDKMIGLLDKTALGRKMLLNAQTATQVGTEEALALATKDAAASMQAAALAMNNMATAQGRVLATSAPAATGIGLEGTAATAATAPTIGFGSALAFAAVGAVLLVGAFFGLVFALYKFFELMLTNADALPAFAFGLLTIGASLAVITPLFAAMAPIAGIAAGVMVVLGVGMAAMGIGFSVLAIGLKLMEGSTATMYEITPALVALGIGAAIAAPFLYSAAFLLAPAGVLLGIGLSALAIGLKMMQGAGPTIYSLVPALIALGIGVALATPLLYAAAFAFAPAAALLGIGFGILGVGLMLMAGSAPTMIEITKTLPLFALALLFTAPAMFLAASTFGIAAAMLGVGFVLLGLGLRLMAGTAETMALVSLVLPLFALSLIFSSPLMFAAASSFGVAAALLGASFIILGVGLMLMQGLAGTMAMVAITMPLFALGLMLSAPLLFAAANLFVPAAIMLGIAFAALGIGLMLMPDNLVEFSTGLMTMAMAIAMMGVTGILSALGIYAVSGALMGLGLALLFISEDDVTNMLGIGEALANMSTVNPETASSIYGVAEALSHMAEALDEMPMFSLLTIGYIMEKMGELNEEGALAGAALAFNEMTATIQATSGLDEDHVSNLEDLIDQVIRYTEETEDKKKSKAVNKLVRILESMTGGGGGGGGAGGGEGGAKGGGQNIYLTLDKSGTKILAKAIGVELDKQNNTLFRTS